jgi:TonB family protein
MAQIGPTMREQYDSVAEKLAALKREATPRQNAGVTVAPPSPVVSSAPVAPTTPTQQGTSGADAQAALNAAHSAEPPQATPGGSQTVPRESSPAAVAQRVQPRDAAREAVSERTSSPEIPGQPTGEGLVNDADTVRVAPSVMEANLVASRVPAYPEFAKTEGIEGRVVMEAVISKSGAVDHVRVIEGDRHLRSAAEDAVLKWRYRPYFMNGRPVDVATVVRVDFRLRGASHY